MINMKKIALFLLVTSFAGISVGSLKATDKGNQDPGNKKSWKFSDVPAAIYSDSSASILKCLKVAGSPHATSTVATALAFKAGRTLGNNIYDKFLKKDGDTSETSGFRPYMKPILSYGLGIVAGATASSATERSCKWYYDVKEEDDNTLYQLTKANTGVNIALAAFFWKWNYSGMSFGIKATGAPYFQFEL